MRYTYEETEKIINELNKVVYAMEFAVDKIRFIAKEYIDIPIGILRKEITELNGKIDKMKSGAIVTYEEDITFINNLLETKEGKS